MIDTQLEKFTSKAAVDAGLIDAIKRGEVKINGAYELTPDGKINFEQNNFVFKDKWGELHVGSFTNADELYKFGAAFSK